MISEFDNHLIYHLIDGGSEPMSKARSSSRGGARPGSGRKRRVQEPKRIAVDLETADFERLRALAEQRNESMAELVRHAIRALLRRSKS